MYAIIKTGGKQYHALEGATIRVEKLDTTEGVDVELDHVLMIGGEDGVQIGNPYVVGAKVIATVKKHGLCKKVTITKFKRRKHYLKRQGHRQRYTDLVISGISVNP